MNYENDKTKSEKNDSMSDEKKKINKNMYSKSYNWVSFEMKARIK